MKNVNELQKKNCLFFTIEELKEKIFECTGEKVEIFCETDGFGYDVNGEIKSSNTYNDALAKHFGIEIVSIHIDDWIPVGVWISYKEIEPYSNNSEDKKAKLLAFCAKIEDELFEFLTNCQPDSEDDYDENGEEEELLAEMQNLYEATRNYREDNEE